MLKYIFLLLFFVGIAHLNSVDGQSDWNLDFENWIDAEITPDLWNDTFVVENRVDLFPPMWHFDPEKISEGRGLGQTTDGTQVTHAVALSGFYNYEKIRIISGENP